ncbi:Cu(I)-responsive transcriptional regulator [Oceanibacterium hippocampi]|uniref:HTH-type transcriptional regulator HmrR n=1 Tax=Oceanibacterium hippocampi TaxID=745714 RepID=A0A1Y5T288_9PROT|nr:Cu(I)-responsive transcriptional regulator [Oceanibacterium hippocampi]SLN54313.1 HTH-type transcriptional regulator HmrR [Oceanibacterium hippocampi]
MNIGELARQSGVNAKTIRYYEEIGLIPAAHRGDNGYRRYRTQDLNRLQFVRRARGLGFSVEDVSALLALYNDRSRHSSDVRAIARRHVAEIDGKIRELVSMREMLNELIESCQGDHRPECPILQDLAGADTDAGTSAADVRTKVPT